MSANTPAAASATIRSCCEAADKNVRRRDAHAAVVVVGFGAVRVAAGGQSGIADRVRGASPRCDQRRATVDVHFRDRAIAVRGGHRHVHGARRLPPGPVIRRGDGYARQRVDAYGCRGRGSDTATLVVRLCAVSVSSRRDLLIDERVRRSRDRSDQRCIAIELDLRDRAVAVGGGRRQAHVPRSQHRPVRGRHDGDGG